MSDAHYLIPPGELPRSIRDAAVRRNATGDAARCAADQCDRIRSLLSAPAARAAAATLRAEATATAQWVRPLFTDAAIARHLTNARFPR